ncbi:MAG: hypothetical protein MUO67_05180, partial [Anaerolineales bacterium]|nr:hypothetical protein [Anaerolineales bacterium]
ISNPVINRVFRPSKLSIYQGPTEFIANTKPSRFQLGTKNDRSVEDLKDVMSYVKNNLRPGQTIGFLSMFSPYAFYEYDLESNTHFLLITGEDLRPMSISPDGQFLVYGLENGLALWIFGRDEIIPVASGEARAPATFSGWLDLSE